MNKNNVKCNNIVNNGKIKYCNLAIPFIMCLFFMTVVLLSLNFVTPLMGEDYGLSVYGYNFKIDSWPNAIIKLFSGCYSQAMNWNARIGEALSRVFSIFDKKWFDICNTLVAICYVFTIYIYAFRRRITKYSDIFYLFVIFTLILLCQPALGEIFFWRTGSTNFLWGIEILLIFMLPGYFLFCDEIDILEKRKMLKIGYILLGFIAGITSENAAFVALIVYILLFIKKKKRPYYFYGSACTFLVSYLFLLFGPSTFHRREVYDEMYGTNMVLGNIKRIMLTFCHSHIIYIILFTILSIGLYVLKKMKINSKDGFYTFFVLSFFCLIPLTVVAYTEVRSFLFIDFFIVVFLVKQIEVIVESYKIINLRWPLITMMVMVLLAYTKYFKIYIDYYMYINARNISISQHINSNTTYEWHTYSTNKNIRVLNPRDDWCMSHIEHMENYYGCKIKLSY